MLIGAILFGYFLTVTQTPQKVTEFLTGLGLGRYGVLTLIMIMYLVLGCLMDALAMIIITVPIIFPVIKELGFDPIWFGVIIVMTVELGLIHPPVGMNIFVIKSVVEDVKISTIFYGVLPFIVTDILRLIILIAFPDHRALSALENVRSNQGGPPCLIEHVPTYADCLARRRRPAARRVPPLRRRRQADGGEQEDRPRALR